MLSRLAFRAPRVASTIAVRAFSTEAASNADWRSLQTKWSPASFSANWRTLDVKLAQMQSEIDTAPKSLGTIDWSQICTGIEDDEEIDAVMAEYEDDLDSDFVDEDDYKLNEFNAMIDQAIEKAKAESAAAAEEIPALQAELDAVTDAAARVTEWSTIDEYRFIPGGGPTYMRLLNLTGEGNTPEQLALETMDWKVPTTDLQAGRIPNIPKIDGFDKLLVASNFDKNAAAAEFAANFNSKFA